MHGRYRAFSMIEPVEIMLTHQRNELVRIVGAGGISGLVDFAGKRLRIILELKPARIASIAKEKPHVMGDALSEAVIRVKLAIYVAPLRPDLSPRPPPP